MTFLYTILAAAVMSMVIGTAPAIIMSLFGLAAILYYRGRNQRQQWTLSEQLSPIMQQFKRYVKAADTSPFRMKRETAVETGMVLLPTEDLLVQVPTVIQYVVRKGMVYQGGSRGVRITPLRGWSFNLGGHRGKMVADTETVTATGWLALTSDRLVFSPVGNGPSFHLPLSKLAGVTRDGNVLAIDSTSRDVPDFKTTMMSSAGTTLLTTLLSNPAASIEVVG